MNIDLVEPMVAAEYTRVKEGCHLTHFTEGDIKLIEWFIGKNYHVINKSFLVTTGLGKIEIEKNRDDYFLINLNSKRGEYYKCDTAEGLKNLLKVILKKT